MKTRKKTRDAAALSSWLVRRPIQRMVWLFLLPTFAAFCIGFLYPFLQGIYLSFCKFRMTSDASWTGLSNYKAALTDPSFLHAFWYTALFAVVSLLLINVLAFTVAYALTQKMRGANLFRAGDKVAHRTLGTGIVKEVRQTDLGTRIDVDFGREKGVRTFPADTAPIIKIG